MEIGTIVKCKNIIGRKKIKYEIADIDNIGNLIKVKVLDGQKEHYIVVREDSIITMEDELIGFLKRKGYEISNTVEGHVCVHGKHYIVEITVNDYPNEEEYYLSYIDLSKENSEENYEEYEKSIKSINTIIKHLERYID
ncbi:hypothetical protein QIW52_15095 [Clostridioides difficile]|nr:hypothetical protein [Clostridioides difficile]